MKTIVSKNNIIVCSFCRKPQHEVAKIVSDPTGKAFICDECIKVCCTIVNPEPNPSK